VHQLCNQFCAVTLSAVYHDVLKDRLYTRGTHDPLRRSSQTAIHHIFHTLVRLLAPILTFTSDEAWSFGTAAAEYSDDPIHLQDWPTVPAGWRNPAIESDMEALLRVRSQVTEAIEPARQAGKIGKSLDAAIELNVGAAHPAHAALDKHRDFLPELFIVSNVSLNPTSDDRSFAVTVHHCQELGRTRCPRCWRWVPSLQEDTRGGVCPRCAEALA